MNPMPNFSNIMPEIASASLALNISGQLHYAEPFKVNPGLVRKLHTFLKKENEIFIIYLDIINFSKLRKDFGSNTCEQIINSFNQSINSLINKKELTESQLIAYHKLADDDFVIYYKRKNSTISSLDLEILHEEALKAKQLVEKSLNESISHWLPCPVSLRVGISYIERTVAKNLPNRIYAGIKEAIRVAEDPNLEVIQDLQELHRIIDQRCIKIVYQPIVSLQTGKTFGCEALCRGPENSKLASPGVLFPLAEETGMLYRLEKLCREQAIVNLTNSPDKPKLFLNINPQVINDPEFTGGITKELLKKTDLTPQDVVFEITERTSIKDFASFKKTLQHYREQGFLIAIDDAGAGYSSLQAIAELKPDFIKVDISLIKNIDHDQVKQALLETFLLFAQKINAKIVAEGIERPEELKKLMELGIDYAQGYFLAKPDYPTPAISQAAYSILTTSLHDRTNESIQSLNLIGEITQKVEMIHPNTQVYEVYELLKNNNSHEGIVVGQNSIPIGLVMRDKLYNHLSTQYGVALYKHKPIKLLRDARPLIVHADMPIQKVAQLATARDTSRLYDCIIVVDNQEFAGIVSVRTLLDYINNMQIEFARCSNPLTGLPGNLIIQNQLIQLVQQKAPAGVIYIDLDNFKAFNDKYGFERGDEAILLTARILERAARMFNEPETFIGHIGGDDFILITKPDQLENTCNEIINMFDREIANLYDHEDRQKGCIAAKDREGRETTFPFMSISLAAIDSTHCNIESHWQISELAAELKKNAKKKAGSVYVTC